MGRLAVADRRAQHRCPGRERGVALVLAFLCLMILVVVMGQITVRSSVERAIALEELDGLRCDYAARAAMEHAQAILLRDLATDTSVPPTSDVRSNET